MTRGADHRRGPEEERGARCEPGQLLGLRILAVDDEPSNLLLLRRILERAGYTNLELTTDPSGVPERFAADPPDLVLLDLHMRDVDGIALLGRLAELTGGPGAVPALVLTADASEQTRRRALEAGASDFLTKPLDRVELLLRARNLLQVKMLQDRLREHNAILEHEVAVRTRDLDQARVETLQRLALAAEYRDDDTQQHAQRIGRICLTLAVKLGLPHSESELTAAAAPLHDIGKIGIPDRILLKPGRLTDAEFEVLKAHTTIGAEILAGSHSPTLRLAERVALSHHERWDGRGYPHGLRGTDIPRAGRLVAVADVFDALVHERPYKRAWPVEDAVLEIAAQAGRQFDPEVAAAFAELDHRALVAPIDDPPAAILERRSAATGGPRMRA